MISRLLRGSLIAGVIFLLAGCDLVLLDPSGDVARQQSDLLKVSTWLMLLIVVPVIAMTLVFAWWYREDNEEATYKPDWDHSTTIELYVWAAPLLIIIAIGALTWINTHTLDPFEPLSRISEDKPIDDNYKPLRIQAIALEWKWLFIYPEQGIATVNEVAAPVDMPIRFEITSPRMMNSLFIPSLAGMVYAMPGMQTQIQAVINEPGDYDGVSGNYSGAGYSDMRFRFHGLSDEDFRNWVAESKASGAALTTDRYNELAKPTIKHPVQRFARVEGDLYHRILNLCVDPERLCVDKMMAMDAVRDQHAKHAASSGNSEH